MHHPITEIQKRKSVHINESGFSLIELMVAMVVFLIVTGAIWGLLQVAQRGRTTVSEGVQLNKSVRFGMNMIGRDTYNAGFGYPIESTVVLTNNRLSGLLGIPADYDTTRDTIPPIIVGNDVTENTFNTTPNTFTDQVTFLFKDSTFNVVTDVDTGLSLSQPLDINAATTVDEIDEILPIAGSNAACRANDIFLVTGSTGSTVGVATGLNGTDKVQFANGDILGFNRTGPSGWLRGITTPASMMRVLMVTYHVTQDGTLMRRRYANLPPPADPWVDEPLVYGVENFQIQYVMDDGSLSDNPSAGPDGVPGNSDDDQANLTKIRQIRFTLSVKSNEFDQTGQPYRSTMTSTFGTRNLGYEAN